MMTQSRGSFRRPPATRIATVRPGHLERGNRAQSHHTHHARIGAALAGSALDVGFFRARWDRATKAEHDYLRAMAVDGDNGSSTGEVARRLGRHTRSLGPARASLIAKGLIYAPDHGEIAFTVPGMADFINGQPT